MIHKKKLNLIDILQLILNTKNEIKDIINSDDQSIGLNDDFSKYSVTIYNYLIEKYNKGYVDGYSDYYQENVGTRRYPVEPLLYKDYLPVSGDNYDPFTVDGLTDIMRDNLGFREDIRDSIEEFNDNVGDQFLTYPEYLQLLKDNLYSNGYDDGQIAASETILSQESVTAPTASFSDNIFTLQSTQEYQVLWFKVGENGVEIRYDNPVYVPYDCTIYYWSTIGQAISDGDKNAHYINCVYVPTTTLPENVVFILPPEILFENKKIYLKNVNEENTTLEYCINPEVSSSQWKQYNGPILIGSGMQEISVRAYSSDGVLSDVDTVSIPHTQQTGDPQQPTIELVPPEKVNCQYDFDSKTVVLSCETQGAGIQYVIDEGDWVEYTGSFTIPQRIVILYTRSYIDYGEYGIYYTSNAYRLSGYVFEVRKPNISTLSDGKVYISTGMSGSTIKYAITDNENDTISFWTDINATSISLYVDDDKWVHAKTIYNSRESEVTHYYYNWYSITYNLDTPTYTFENNYLMISSPYTVYYTTDGSDPRYNREHMWGGSLAIYGLPITQTTTVRAIAVYYDSEEDYTHYSETVSWTLTPTEDVSQDLEYFYVKGATSISISGTYLYWSYDKVNWTYFSTCTGLDPTRKVYLRSGANGVNNIGTFSFEGYGVEVGGNIISLFRGANYINNQDLNPPLRGLFKNCTALYSAYNLVIPNTSCEQYQYYEMFSGCTNLVNGPKQFYFNNIEQTGCGCMFKGCTSLQSTPIMTINSIENYGCIEMFSGCTSLFTSNINLLLSKVGNLGCNEMFSECTHLSFINMTVNENCELSQECFKYMFKNANIVNHNIRLNATTLVEKCYSYMFSGSGITQFSNLPAAVMKDLCYSRMFENCTQLNSFGNIEATTLANSCMSGMFSGCTRLQSAPVLKSQTLVTGCYNWMFEGCSSLNFIKATFLTDPLVNDNYPYTSNWVYGVSDSGVFVQNDDATWYETGVHAIPVNWTVEGSGISVGTILSVSVDIDKVTIYASNDDDLIQYQFNDQYDWGWTEYNGSFSMTSQSATIYCRCVNSRGIIGPVYSQEINCNNLPTIQINVNGNIVTVINPNNFYSSIYYAWEEYGGGQVGGWLIYSEPLDMGYGKQGRLNVRGITSGGVIGGTNYRDIQTVEENTIPTPYISMSNNKVYITGNGSYGIRYSKDGTTWYDYSEPIDILENDSYIMYSYCIDRYTGRISEQRAQLYIFYQQGQSKVNTPIITCHNNIVTITCSTSGATIYYTTNGNNPTISSNVYTSPIEISSTTTFKAIGIKSGWINSDIQTQECQYIAPHDYSRDFFTITATKETTIRINTNYVNTSVQYYIKYKYNSDNWKSAFYDDNVLKQEFNISLQPGDTVQFKTIKSGTNRFCSDPLSWEPSGFQIFYSNNPYDTSGCAEISGNIQSLITSSSSDDEFIANPFISTYNQNDYYLARLFWGCAGIYDASHLILDTVKTNYCYYQMFRNCLGLRYAPESIDISNSTPFIGICTGMFYECSNLIIAPNLPAITLGNYCYSMMFASCTSLTTAPSLPTATLAIHCYDSMFYGCTSLNYIKCLATNISANNCTDYWLSNVSETGTFVKASSMSGWTSGESGIPEGWTVQNNS